MGRPDSVAMVMSWRVALLLVSAVALCAADAEMEYPQVYELAEMAEGDGAYGRDLATPKANVEEAKAEAEAKIKKIAEAKAKAAAEKAKKKVEQKLEAKVEEAKAKAESEKKALEENEKNAEKKQEEA